MLLGFTFSFNRSYKIINSVYSDRINSHADINVTQSVHKIHGSIHMAIMSKHDSFFGQKRLMLGWSSQKRNKQIHMLSFSQCICCTAVPKSGDGMSANDLFAFINQIHIVPETYYLALLHMLRSHTRRLVSTSLFTQTFETPSEWRLCTWKSTWAPAKLKTVKKSPAHLFVPFLSVALQVCVCVCHRVCLIFIEIQFPREGEVEREGEREREREREREIWSQTGEVKQHSPQLEVISSTPARYLSVYIFQPNSTPLNHVSPNMAEICFQSEVLPMNRFWFCCNCSRNTFK